MGRLTTLIILKDLIHIPSITGDVAACPKIVALSQSILQAQKVPSKIIKLKKHKVLVWGNTDIAKSVWLINSHLDVVPGKSEQFIPQEMNGKIWGRGSADTKCCAAILLANASKWQKEALDKYITFMLVTDEETGGESTKEILGVMGNLKGAVFMEPTDERIVTQAKGIMQVKITASGKSCHGSRPWNGISALEILTSSINKFRLGNPTPIRETKNTTFNFSIFQSGSVINQIPNMATVWCDVRWNPDNDPRKIIKKFQRVFNKCKVEVIKSESPINCDKNSQIVKDLFRAACKEGLKPTFGFEHGSSDARHCTARNIPAIVFGPIGGNLHADSEWVDIKSIEKVTSVIDSWIGVDLDIH